jgi:amino acid adenylation domain-containing protein/non-ribosomal peptide synthase protein (TIGR01720 family)
MRKTEKTETISALLESRTATQGDDPAYIFLSYSETGIREERLTYAELDRRARAIGASLQEVGAGGERVVLLLPPGPEFVAAFFGCLYAGAVAVPALPPRRRGDERLRAICRDSCPRVALATAGHLQGLESAAAEIPELAAAHRMSPAREGGADWQRPELGPDALAFLQYTSGSTSSPKGVMVSHGNLLHNEERIRHTFEQSSDSIVLGWLPLHHDMGLIGTVLQPLYTGVVCFLMTPGAFLQRPARWLEAISRYRATTSGGPDFAYELCVRKVAPAERENLDLSSWRVAFNGAEPVRASTLRRFAAAFAPCGFRAAAFRPCYGLAEATLLVSGWRAGGEPRVCALAAEALERHEAVAATVEGRELVGCGAPQQIVLAADPESGTPCPPGRIGEIWVAGPSVAQGYWQRPEETAATFGARLADGSGPFLRTGDLGFLADGELFVTGRLKDLLILRGRNHYPQDLERSAESSHPGLRPGASAAFAVDAEGGGEERLVLVCEVERRAQLRTEELAAVAQAVRRAVAEEHGVAVSGVALLRTGTIPKTSSGKIRRRECRARYLSGGLEELYRSEGRKAAAERLLTRVELLALAPAERSAALTAWLCEEIACHAGGLAGAIGPETSLAAAGLDSLSLFELQGRLERDLGCALPATALVELSVSALCARLLDQLAASPESSVPDLPVLVPGEVLGDHPASPGQEALWLLEPATGEGDEGGLHIAGAARLGAVVDLPALLSAARALSARHAALRTTFRMEDGELHQWVHANLPPDLEQVDATAWSREELDGALRREARRRFDLGGGPPLRIRAFLRPDGERVLLFVLHHLAGDFGSLAVLLRDWTALYARELDGRLPTLPDLPVAYTDFVRWQRQWLAGPAGERLERYWLDRLRGAPLVLDLPTDRPRLRTANRAGALVLRRLAPGLAERVRALARTEGATLFTVLLAAFQVLLGRLTGQDDLLVGSPATGRRDPALDRVVGYFVNPVVLRADLSRGAPFARFLAQTRASLAAALEHRDLPFAQLARRLQPERESGRPPVVQALFVLHRAAPGQSSELAGFAVGEVGVRIESQGLALESLSLDPGTAQLDLTLSAAEVGDALAFSCEYATALLDGVTVGRWLRHLENLLDAVAARPEARLAELPWLNAAERHQLLVEWSDTAVFPARDTACLHELFEIQARRTPEAVALVDGTREILYRQLDEWAERLASRLRDRGAFPEAVVGICLERSAEMVAALLAILKAGAAYLPLDPRQPRPRLAAMLTSARPVLVVSNESPAAELPWSGPLLLIDPDFPPAVLGPPSRPIPHTVPENLAYVLYTSGSTGTPKGVAVTHRSAVEMVRWAGGVFVREELSGVLAATSLSFDLSVFELFVPLAFGGTAILATNVLDLPSLLARGRVTLVNTVPAVMAELVSAGGLLASVRTVCLAGEPLPRALVERLYATGTVECVWNLYGPSEDTTYSTASRVTREGEEAPGIGRPIAATRARVLSAGAEAGLEPVGVPGELHLGGAGLARGYLYRPDLTAERFVPDPWPEEPGARLYRTGDLVRFRAEGSLDFLGRLDHQVKIRGFRIELGEIEAVLSTLPEVREAVVAAREDRSGGRALVAYVVGDATVEALRRSLRERLPEPMVPAVFVRLPDLPRTPSGKVDRKALPAPEWPSPGGTRQAPRSPVGEVVAGIWAELLGVERVGLDDGFFALGGHSLLGTRAISRLRAAFGVEVPLSTFFEAPVLADFAARVEAALSAGAAGTPPPLAAMAREGPPPLSFAQQRLWLVDQIEPGSPLYNMPGALRIQGPLDGPVLARCLAEIVRRHEALRTVFAAPAGAPVQVIRPPSPFPLSEVDLSGLGEETREPVASALRAEEAARPFDLARGPLLRCFLLRLAEGDHLAVLTLHHIASDGWSLGILAREITALYSAFAAGRPSPLPELPVQYADFAVWQRSWLAGEVLDGEIAFWRRQLAGLPPLLKLPTDRPRPAVQSFRGGSRPLLLPAGLTRDMEILARRSGATLFMVLLAGFQALLARWSGQDDLAVGAPVSGRTHREVEPLIGFFVNTLVLRADLSGAPSLRELLGRVRETAMVAYLHQDVPFERLVDELAPERSLAHTPLFQVMFALQNAPVESLEIHDLQLRPVRSETGTAKFDLSASLEEHYGGLAGTVEYAADLFDRVAVDRLTVQYERLLTAALATPERPVAELPLLSAAERHQLQVEWNDTTPTAAMGVVELFEAQARRTPEAVAIVSALDEGSTLTYGELDRRADRLAVRLSALGVVPEMPVGLCVEPSPDLVMGVLGILKSGGAYLPLDLAQPPARLSLLLEDSGAPVLVTRRHLSVALPPHGARVVLLPVEETARGESAPRRSSPSDLAYLIYTSGTTGRPKAVLVEHGMLAATLGASRELFGFTAADRISCLALPTFDISLFELLSPLSTGGTAMLFPLRPALEVEPLVDRLGELTCLHAVPALMREIVGSLRRRGVAAPDVGGIRAVFVGGDAVPADLLEELRVCFPGAQVWILYGPTEGTIVCTAHRVSSPPKPVRVVLGRPLAGAVLHVCNAHGELLPLGVPGELWIGGSGVTRGYLGRAELTADKYVPGDGGRFYRSGDRVRRSVDGSLEFFGRLDHQVKIRGFRVEPGEIEAALVDLPGVRAAAVVVREDRPGERRLVAYVAGEAARDALRRSLRERLPDYMVPAAFVTLHALPLTPNGKVDRKALPAPEPPVAREEYAAPRTREEGLLAAVWAQVLRLPRVGVDDNFFALGGDSILAVQIVARVREMGLAFTVRQVFEHQTVASLARHVTATDTAAAPFAEQGPVAGEVPLTPIQSWFFSQSFSDPHHFNQALLLEPRESLSPAALKGAMAAILEHHDALRLCFRRGEAGGWRQVNAPAEPETPFHQLDFSRLPETRFHAAFDEAAAALQASFDLSTGPLTRLCQFHLAAGRPDRLLWVAHHLVVDGVSWRVLLEDLEGAYRQAARGLHPSLPPKTTSFQEWARRLAGYVGSEELARELGYWRETARASVPPLPVDFLSDGGLAGDEAAVDFELTAEETADLLQALPAVYHNRIDEALLSALIRALASWTRSPRLRVDLEGHGREPLFDDLDVSRTVGWFTTIHPFILEAGEADPGEALVRTKERLRAVPRRGIGYGLLRPLRSAAEGGDGEAARFLEEAPAEILFNYLGQVDATINERSLFQASRTSAGPARSPRAHRTHRLEVSGIVAGGRLRITLTYGSRTHRRETAERLATAYAGALRQLIQHGRKSEEVFTPSDFPQAALDAESFDQLAALLDEAD